MTRLFLSPKLKQSLAILSYNARDLLKKMKKYEEANPFLNLKYPQQEMQDLSWLEAESQESLIAYLEQEVAVSKYSVKEKKLLTFLIYQLDEQGYLRISDQELSQKSGFTLAQVRQARKDLQKIAPVGVGAFNLTECLLLQAQAKEDFNPIAREILTDNLLEIVADPNKWQQLKWSKSEIENALVAIRKLNPNPASDYSPVPAVNYLIPDLIFKFEDGQMRVLTSKYFLPEVVFDEPVYQELKQKSNRAEQKFLTQQKKNYREINAAVGQRSETLLRIGKYLGQKQLAFLKTLKKNDLQALGLKEIAEQLDLAPSTISRALKYKYFECQGQVLPLNLFLVKKVADQSQEKIKALLVNWVDQEDKIAPYSDEELVQLFADKDIKLSRRVIAKYRKQLGIANSYQRKSK
ncbi:MULTISPECIES: RNA polymerase factor sigma-54 [Lactobacillus]|uniref:RNA polymerase sigma-54 factor n=1 Tax=Lactobacillus xujianguonis TaxID=2495899 RepID=A0A437SWQ8_9LACO|nr:MULTISPECIES: RNA polymerase factor sigma-54 [Lactobacillus]RVU71359.1 RNA polymerase sigma-54 factor [Lactobacillus xujianguonis]RVU76980.1 RNA polymerase sigma-54 factor [Lactobacillus xujianguonis]